MIFRQDDGAEEGLGTEFYTRPEGEFTDDMIAMQARSVYSKFVGAVQRGIGSNAKIVVLRIPYGYEIHPEDIARYASSGMRLSKPDMLQKHAESVAGLAAEMSYLFIDPFEALRDNAVDERQYNFIDVHFTPAGNKTVAEHAAPVIQELINSEG
jgi:lysophospholipase L1-like esterase